jgi:hypothetical protein
MTAQFTEKSFPAGLDLVPDSIGLRPNSETLGAGGLKSTKTWGPPVCIFATEPKRKIRRNCFML